MFDDDDDAICKKSVQKILWFDATTQNSFTLIAEGSNMSHYRATGLEPETKFSLMLCRQFTTML